MALRPVLQQAYEDDAMDRAHGVKTGIGTIDQQLDSVSVSEVETNWKHKSVDTSEFERIDVELVGPLETFTKNIDGLLGSRVRPLSNLPAWQDLLRSVTRETSVDRRKVEEYLVVSMSARQGQGYGDERISFEQREIWQALDHAFGWSGNRMTITKFCRGDAERVRHFLWPLGRLRNETPEGGWRDGASLQSLAYTIKSPVEINRAQAKAKKKILKSFGLTDWETMRTTTVLVGVVALVLLIVGVGLWVI